MSSHFFLIRGRQSGLVLDVEGSGTDAGTPVILFEETGMDNQLWFYDRIDGCIRSKQTNMCLDFDDENTLVVNEYSGEHKQLFEHDSGSGVVKNSKDSTKVLDVAGHETDPGTRICVWEPTGEDNQLFDLDYQPPSFFVIISLLNDKVIDVKDSDESAGAKLIMFERNDGDNQQFYQDKNSLIRAKLNDFCFESAKGIGCCGKPIQLKPASKKPQQDWVLWRDRVVNLNNHTKDVIEIKKANQEDGAQVIFEHFSNSGHEKWRIEYV